MFRTVFWDILPCKMIVDRRFRGTYCLHHHSSLMMEAVRTSETSLNNHFTRQYIPEDSSEHHTRRRESLKSHITVIHSNPAGMAVSFCSEQFLKCICLLLPITHIIKCLQWPYLVYRFVSFLCSHNFLLSHHLPLRLPTHLPKQHTHECSSLRHQAGARKCLTI
jgi:hypothetical protein